MTNEQVIELAKQAGWKELPTVRLAFAGFELQRFAELVRNEVLEEAVKQRVILPNEPQGYYMSMSPMQVAKEDGFIYGFKAGAKAVRDAIRSMKK